eukprot:CAMPEP_0202409186 /NCGR_PEP_ID=MMETSP1128-20130828/16492_1 /ASSEMBLY_ACC=CAM_ASM_000463 /TAXON_ID=3047 /ORGANISM="Dunaliella tertiolecta, Strain CCMP1320" /LENGTH=39 /DNA_ID= /DNA_START= /DNA_END= /DNA_ORIENTATION=
MQACHLQGGADNNLVGVWAQPAVHFHEAIQHSREKTALE